MPLSTDGAPRVLIFNGSGFIEGDTKVALGVARALAGTVSLEVVSAPGDAADAFAALPGAVVKRTCGSRLMARTVSALSLGLSAGLRRRPALIYTYDRTHAADVACLLGIALRIPFVFHINNSAVFSSQPWRFRMARHAQELWSVSEFVRSAALAAGVAGTHVTMFNALLDPPAEESRAEARRALGIPPEQRTVFLVGRLSPFKGQATLVRALADARLAERDVHAYIVGHGTGDGAAEFPPRRDFAAYLRALAEEVGSAERVHLLGWKRGSLAFRAADVACVLSDAEPFGLVVPEAVAAGVPLVAVRSGAIPELLEHGETALLVGPRDPRAVADSLVALFDEPALGRRLVTSAAQRCFPRLDEARFASEVRARVGALLARRA